MPGPVLTSPIRPGPFSFRPTPRYAAPKEGRGLAMGWTRRTTLLGGAVLLACAATPVLAVDAGLPFKLVDLGHNVFAGIDIDGRAGSNAGFVIGDDGVLVI